MVQICLNFIFIVSIKFELAGIINFLLNKHKFHHSSLNF